MGGSVTLYRYKAISKEGTLERGFIEVSSAKDVKLTLQTLNLSPISYSRDFSSLLIFKTKTRALLELSFHLEQFERAGIPLKDSLEELKNLKSSSQLQSIMAHVLTSLECGDLFSTALCKHPQVFDSIFVSLVMMGEKTGHMAFAYQHLIQHLKWVETFHSQTVKALRYPLILSLVLMSLIITLLTVLVPELIQFFQGPLDNLPLSTLILITLSAFLSNHLLALLSGVIGWFFLLIVIFKSHPNGVLWKDWIFNQIPFVGRLRKSLFLTRFFHIFSTLFESGIDILQALQTARKSLPPGQMSLALENLETHVKEGLSLSKAFQKADVFPPIVIRMVKIGEKTSALPKTLSHLKDHFDQSLKWQVDSMLGYLEPIIIFIMGFVMTWIVYAVFLPLYDTFSNLDY
jgi:type IV pilus assembly protein PilC